jgi:hypothetical protein
MSTEVSNHADPQLLDFDDMLKTPGQHKVDDLMATTLYQDEHSGDYYDSIVSPPTPYDRDMNAAQMCTFCFILMTRS